MNAEHARAIADAMTSLWEGEFPATLRVITAVNEGNRDYRPDPKSRSAWDLITHIALSDLFFVDGIIRNVFELDADAAKAAEARFQTVDDVASFYEVNMPAKLAELRELSGAELAGELDFFGMMKRTRAEWIGFATNHSVHHRGQLSASLRALGAKVPDIYGPSADAEPAA